LAATEYSGIFRSSNGGTSWTNVQQTGHATQFASYGGALFATGTAGILTSADDGVTWTVQVAGTAKRYPTAFGSVERSGEKALYAGMTDGTIFAFASGKWTKTGTLPYIKHPGVGGTTPAVHQITVDPFKATTVYASSNDGAWDQNLHASTDGGHTWNTVLKNQYYNYGLGTQAIAFSVVHQHRLYLGEDGGFYYILGDGSPNPQINGAANLSVIDIRNVWTSANGADDACWIASDQGLDYVPACSTGGSYSDDVVTKTSAIGLGRRFTVSGDQKTLLVSLQDFSSHLTTDGGKTWSVNGPLYEDGFNELRPGSPNDCYAYDEASGLSISTDGCRSFNSPGLQIVPSRLMTTPVAFDPKSPLTMYFASGPVSGPGISGPKGLFRSTNGGSTVSQMTGPIVWPGAVAVDPANGAHILVGDMRPNGSALWVTTNSGKTWTQSSGVIPTKFWYALTISPASGKTVLASSVDPAHNVFVLRSIDGGRTFKKVAVVTNAPLLRGRFDPDRQLFRGRGQKPREQDVLGGQSQAYVYSPEREIRYNQDVTKGTPDAAITTLNGAFLSRDNGSTWTRIDLSTIAHSFWGIRWVSGFLYLGSDGQGVMRSTTLVQRKT
jgi:hypothetical protein